MKATVKMRLQRKIDDSYEIVIGERLFPKLAASIVRDCPGEKYCIITDSNLKNTLAAKLLKQFKAIGADACIVSFTAGEKNKNISTVEKVLEQMLAKGVGRGSAAVALGGGVVGDIAGFCASIYMRGIDFVQAPTTLLAMVDSSIGGKTGVNLSSGKNSAGTFSQPKKVYACPELLKGLPKREIRNGLSEVIKHAVIFDKRFFSFLERNSRKILSLDPKTLSYIIKRNCELKAKVVEKDEMEGNYRRVLNFGHTIGHAIESAGHYAKLSHAEAIAIGMVCESEISNAYGLMKRKEVERLISLFQKFGLPVSMKGYDSMKILRLTKTDKKASMGCVNYSLPAGIGKMHSLKGDFGIPVDDLTAATAMELCR